MKQENESIAVLLLNLGGPDSLGSIRPFLFNLFSDRDIIRLPAQPLLARLIARSRAKKVRHRYEAIGGASPLLSLTNDQAKALETYLNETQNKELFKVYVGMRYWHPFIGDTVDEIIRNGHRRMIVLTLFPHYSRATTGSCFKETARSVPTGSPLSIAYIDSWPDHPLYIEALADSLRSALAEFDEPKNEIDLLFTAHSLPKEFVEGGDPYVDHIHKTIEALLPGLGKIKWQLGFQSRSGPVEWLEPSTEQVLDSLAEAGAKAVLMCPISFISDHIETLYEIDIMYRERAEAQGIRTFKRCSSLNSAHKFIEGLSQIVLAAAG
ncbi:MAG: ferrochelatase [Terriglobia bacterium]